MQCVLLMRPATVAKYLPGRNELKGIVFNLLEEVVTREYSADTWDDLLDAASVNGSYTSLGSYPDGDLSILVMAAASALQQDPEDVIRWFVRRAVPLLADKYTGFFQPHD